MSQDSDGGSVEERHRKALSRWHALFPARQQEPLGSSRGITLRWLLLGVAAAVLVVGFSWRGERFRQLGQGPDRPADLATQIRHELEVEGTEALRLEEMCRAFLHLDDSLGTARVTLSKRLHELSLSRSDLNQNQALVLGQLRALDSLRLEARHSLLDTCRTRLGLWRAARLAGLLP
jgi:hypothetical protein